MNDSKKPQIFFAIPCGEFFRIQRDIITNICDTFKIKFLIIEDNTRTDFLWKKIVRGIDDSDYFIADISSQSPNIILELGYALREKKNRFNAIFISSNIEPPVDLQGLVLQKYSSFKDFGAKLIKWIEDNVVCIETSNSPIFKIGDLPKEDFKDLPRFLQLWSAPGGSFSLTYEGLRVMNSNFPIMTNYLSHLTDYEFEFKAKIEVGAIGWAVKGTKRYQSIVPDFCVMFNITINNMLTPHIFNINYYEAANAGYRKFDGQEMRNIKLKKLPDNWFIIKTIVKGDKITILNNGKAIFSADFSKKPYAKYYKFPLKQGEIGFRCYQGVEEAVVNYFNIREI